MRRLFFFLLTAGVLGACAPALNWRGVPVAGTSIKALLPCKPDHGSRPVALPDGSTHQVHMSGCEAEGILFAVAWADAGSAPAAAAFAGLWQSAMLANLRADAPEALALPGARGALAGAVRVGARGRRADGRTVQAQGLWWTQGTRVFHAALYADVLKADVADTFFSGIEAP